jgi:hypothetical protein
MNMKYLSLELTVFCCLLYGCIDKDIQFYRIQEDNLYGYIDIDGDIAIEPKFTYASDFHDGLAYARIDSLIGYINMRGIYKYSVTIKKERQSKIRIDSASRIIFDSIWVISPPIHEENPFFTSNSLYFKMLKDKGNMLKPDENDISFSEGLALFYNPQSLRFGYINKRGKYIIGPRFSNGGKFINGLARVQIDDKTGFIKRDGTFLVEPKYSSATDFSGGLASAVIVKEETSEDGVKKTFWYTYVIDSYGNFKPEPQGYFMIEQFQNEYALVTNYVLALMGGSAYKTFIDKSLRPQTEEYFEDAKGFSENFAAIKINGKWGFVNSSFSHFIDIIYDDAQSFKEGLAPVKNENSWGYIDRDGNTVINFMYERCTSFNNGLAYVWLDNNGIKTEGYINKSGYLVWSKETE